MNFSVLTGERPHCKAALAIHLKPCRVYDRRSCAGNRNRIGFSADATIAAPRTPVKRRNPSDVSRLDGPDRSPCEVTGDDGADSFVGSKQQRPIHIDAEMCSFDGLIAVDNTNICPEQICPLEPGSTVKLAAGHAIGEIPL